MIVVLAVLTADHHLVTNSLQTINSNYDATLTNIARDASLSMGSAIRLLLERSFNELISNDKGFMEEKNVHYVVMFSIMCWNFGVGVGIFPVISSFSITNDAYDFELDVLIACNLMPQTKPSLSSYTPSLNHKYPVQ